MEGACPWAVEDRGRNPSAGACVPAIEQRGTRGRGPGVRGVAELGGSVRRRLESALRLASPGDRKRP